MEINPTLRRKGLFYAAIAAITFGTNPLFALPLYGEGFDVDSVLLLRYLPSAVILGILVGVRRQSFALTFRELCSTAVGGVLFAISSLALYKSYQRMDAGVASTLLFIYPAIVAGIMWGVFHEKMTRPIILAMLLCALGILLLCRKADGAVLDPFGMVLVAISALAYAVYLVAVNRSATLRAMPVEKSTFYLVLFGMLLFLFRVRFGLGLEGNFTPFAWLNIAGISLLASALSMICTTLALQSVGATPTAILGALEPATAVFFGVVVFHEELTGRIVLGILLILSAVILIALKRR